MAGALACCLGCGTAMMNAPAASQAPISFTPGTVSATAHPLVAKYSFTSPVAAMVTVEFGTDTFSALSTSPKPVGAGQTVQILVAGMRASTTYHMRAVVVYDGGTYFDPDLTFTTGTASAAIPQFVVTRTGISSPGPGVELLDMVVPNGKLQVAAVDLDGNLIWYYAYDSSLGYPYPIRPMPNGDVLITIGTQLLREIDLSGATVREVSLTDLNTRLASSGSSVAVTAIHHDTFPLANGHIVVICEETRPVRLAGASSPTLVRGDALVDLDGDFVPHWTWSAFDHLDVNRHPMDIADWTHGNALLYSPSDGSLFLSMRNQHWILKIDYANGTGSGKVLWRLGVDGDFVLSGGQAEDWFYGQHFPSFAAAPSSTPLQLAVFDNRAANQDGSLCVTSSGICYSRPMIISVDEVAMVATVDWADPLPLYSLWGGSIEVLSGGTVEFTLSNPFPSVAARTMEVTPDTKQLVWQLDILGQLAYRAYRVPSLYPGVQW